MPSETFLKLKSLCEEFSAAETAEDGAKMEALNAEEKRLVRTLPPEEKYQYYLEQLANAYEVNTATIEAHINEYCDNADPVIRASFIHGWAIGLEKTMAYSNKVNAEVYARINKRLGDPEKHRQYIREKIREALAPRDIKGPTTLQ